MISLNISCCAKILGGSFVWFESLCDGNPDIHKCCNTLKAIRCNMPDDVLKTFIPSVGRPHSKMFDVTFRAWGWLGGLHPFPNVGRPRSKMSDVTFRA